MIVVYGIRKAETKEVVAEINVGVNTKQGYLCSLTFSMIKDAPEGCAALAFIDKSQAEDFASGINALSRANTAGEVAIIEVFEADAELSIANLKFQQFSELLGKFMEFTGAGENLQ